MLPLGDLSQNMLAHTIVFTGLWHGIGSGERGITGCVKHGTKCSSSLSKLDIGSRARFRFVRMFDKPILPIRTRHSQKHLRFS